MKNEKIHKPSLVFPIGFMVFAALTLGMSQSGFAAFIAFIATFFAVVEWRGYWIVRDAYKKQQAQK